MAWALTTWSPWKGRLGALKLRNGRPAEGEGGLSGVLSQILCVEQYAGARSFDPLFERPGPGRL